MFNNALIHPLPKIMKETPSVYLEWSSLENYRRNVSPHFCVHLTPQRSTQMSPKSACKPSMCPISTKRGASLLITLNKMSQVIGHRFSTPISLFPCQITSFCPIHLIRSSQGNVTCKLISDLSCR